MSDSEIRVGRISSVNYDSGMARVTYRDKGDSVTSEFSLITNNDEYRMPEVGQSVLVSHLSNGSSRGVVIGTLWNKKHIPNETGKEIYRKELSRDKNAAYVRYSDETGEYLVKAANLHLNGVNKTMLDGPELEIAANISILLQSECMHVDISELHITGYENGAVSAEIKTDVNIHQEENSLEAVIKKAALELIENLVIKAAEDIHVETDSGMDVSASSGMKISAGGDVEIASGQTLRLSDGTYSVTLAEIMEKLGNAEK